MSVVEPPWSPSIPAVDLPRGVPLVTRFFAPTGGDDGALVSAAVGTPGTYLLGPGTFVWGTVPQLGLGNVSVYGSGRWRTVLQPTAAAIRGFDCDSSANTDQLVQNIELADFTLDFQNIVAGNGCPYGILGNNRTANLGLRTSFANIGVRRVRAINGPPSVISVGVMLYSKHTAANQNQSTMTDVVLDDVEVTGGINGANLNGSANGFSGLANFFYDRISVPRFYHDVGAVGQGAGANLQIGSDGYGGKVELGELHLHRSKDVGLEVDSCQSLSVGTIFSDNCQQNPVLLTNPHIAVGSTQLPTQIARIGLIRHRNTVAQAQQVRTLVVSVSGSGLAYGDIEVGTISVSDESAAATTPIVALYLNQSLFNSLTVGSIYSEATNITANNGGFQTVNLQPAQSCRVKIGLIREYTVGTASVAQTHFGTLSVSASVAATLRLEVDAVEVFRSLAANVTEQAIVQILGTAGAPLSVGGYVRNVHVTGAGTQSRGGVYIQDPTILNLIPRFDIAGCDLASLTGNGGTEIVFTSGGSGSNAQNAHVHGNRYFTKPAQRSLAGLVSGTGSVTGYPYKMLVTFIQASGAAITSLDYSTDSGGTYTNFLTQASGALPAGFDQTLGPLMPDALIKATFTATQPTIRLAPVDP